jgi:hypothetical protein
MQGAEEGRKGGAAEQSVRGACAVGPSVCRDSWCLTCGCSYSRGRRTGFFEIANTPAGTLVQQQ